jgi:sulfate transport system permease protein
VLPGFGLSTGFTLAYLGLVVILPLSALALQATSLTWSGFFAVVTSPRALASFRLSVGAALSAAAVNVLIGVLLAWTLTRYRFPGRTLADAVVDLPFALPTAVSGIALTTLYSAHGWLGAPLERLGIKVAFTPIGIGLALTFIGLPFVVRTVQPVLEAMERDQEEAAATLGATRLQTLVRIVLPQALPAALTGFALAFARALGEYGSVVFIAGTMPGKTEIAPLLIMTRLEQFDTPGATALAVVLLAFSFLMLLAINRLQAFAGRRTHGYL